MTYQVVPMNLFDAPSGAVLVHACNCKGVWGAGIATEFKSKFPLAWREYNNTCVSLGPKQLIGKSLILYGDEFTIGCLMTSVGYGPGADSPAKIQEQTKTALEDLFQKLKTLNKPAKVFSNKFNSGLFRVPWSVTEAMLKRFLEANPDIDWTVCDYDVHRSPQSPG